MNDIVLRVNNTDITGKDIFSAVDEVLEHVRETSDLEPAKNAIIALVTMERLTGMAKAKLLSGLQNWWDDTGQDELTNDTFTDWVYDIDTEFNSLYLKRCTSVWNYQENGTFSERIQDLPIKSRQAIASHLDQGYSLTKNEWKELERSDNTEVLRILRDAKGKPPRKHSLIIYLERNGQLSAWKEGEKYTVGYLNVQDAKQSEAVAKAIERIVKNTGIQVK